MADCLAKERMVIRLIDFTVASDEYMKEAHEEKESRYAQLCKMIKNHLGPGKHDVAVLPVVVGRNRIPPPWWATTCRKLKCRVSPSSVWRRVMSCIWRKT